MWNHCKQTLQSMYMYVQILQENSKSASTERRNKLSNLNRDIVIHLFINRDFENIKAIELKEMINSSNCILVTYLSDIETKYIPRHCCMILANLLF